MNTPEYTKRQRIALLLHRLEALKALDEWLYRAAPCELHIRRSKENNGMVTIITTITPIKDDGAMYWLSWCEQHLNILQVNLKLL